MTPHTVHWIAQEIQAHRHLLTTQETWAQKQPDGVARQEVFRRINFWRAVYKRAEKDLVEQNG